MSTLKKTVPISLCPNSKSINVRLIVLTRPNSLKFVEVY